MCEKAGFREEGTIREGAYKNGQYHDLVLMGVLKSEVQAGERAREQRRAPDAGSVRRGRSTSRVRCCRRCRR